MTPRGHRGAAAVLALLVACTPHLAAARQGAPAPNDRLQRAAAIVMSGPPDKLVDAVQDLKAVLASDPRSAEAHMLLGVAYRRLGLPALMGEVKAELQQAIDLNPGLVPARFYLAHVYLDLGRAAKARDELTLALQQAPGHPQFLALLGETERQLGDPAKAIGLVEQALKADPSFAEARYYLGLALFDSGRQADAIRELEQVVQSGPAVVEPYVGLGSAYLDVERVDDGVKMLERAAAIEPGRADTNIRLARAYRLKGLLTKAEAQLKLATPGAGSASGYEQQRLDADYYIEQGSIRLARGQLAGASTSFQKVLEMDANHGPATRGLAAVCLRQGQIARASELAAKADKLGAPLGAADRKLLQDRLRGGAGKRP